MSKLHLAELFGLPRWLARKGLLGLSLLLATAFLFSPRATGANLLTNGSFESPVVTPGTFQQFDSGSTGITGWTVTGPPGKGVAVTSGTFTVNGLTLPAEDGGQWLDLTGDNSNDVEGVSQTVTTVSGTIYTLTFWVGNVTGAGGTTSTVGLKINGAFAANFTNSAPGTTLSWQKFSYSFIATSATTAVEFDNLDPTPDNSDALDNVDLEEGGSASPSPVNLITNGDFETPVISAGAVLNINSGAPDLTGWTVLGTAPSTVALVSGALVFPGIAVPAEDGAQWLDLTGSGYSTGTRGISQNVATAVGTTYQLSFWVGNIYDPSGTLGLTSTVGVLINGASAGSFSNTDQVTTMSWHPFSLVFTATGTSTNIEFDNLDPAGDSSNGLDNVVLQQLVLPSVATGGVISASGFGAFSSISPGTFIEIYGSNLASDTRGWTGADFNGVNAPTSLDGSAVSIAGQAAFVNYISPLQINALVPSNVPTGPQPITVTTGGGTSNTYTINVNAVEPGLLAPYGFLVNVTQYVVAQFLDGSYAVPAGAIPGVTSRPANPGDIVVIYGIGFGPTTPDIPAGQLVSTIANLNSNFEISIGVYRQRCSMRV